MADTSVDSSDVPAGAGPAKSSAPVARRALLGAGAAAVLFGSNAITLVASSRAAEAAVEARAAEERSRLEAEIRLLQRQLAVYRELDRIGLDDLIRTLLEWYDRLWPMLRDGAGLLLGALSRVEEGLSHFEGGLAGLRSAVGLVADLLSGLEARLKAAQDAIARILGSVPPLGQAVGSFLTWLIGKIPFGLGSTVLEAAEKVGELGSWLPRLAEEARSRLLSPLDEGWLSQREGEGLEGKLFQPLREKLLGPLRSHLEEVRDAATRWDTELAPSLRAALDERLRIRHELDELEHA
ncbi:MAG: hypothetical protein K6V36_14960 [Anaerolineae bacterium]|nr:hypothetical protein [Anaerolineae bacterium]